MRASASDVVFQQASAEDFPRIWPFFREVVKTEDTYALPARIPQEAARAYWMPQPGETWLAMLGEEVAGSYYLRPNHAGSGNHVANAGFMVAPEHRRQGIARKMGEHALRTARERGFEAMQFNAVVSSNLPAVSLWKSLGFSVIGTVPGGFRHPEFGRVDLSIMYRKL